MNKKICSLQRELDDANEHIEYLTALLNNYKRLYENSLRDNFLLGQDIKKLKLFIDRLQNSLNEFTCTDGLPF